MEWVWLGAFPKQWAVLAPSQQHQPSYDDTLWFIFRSNVVFVSLTSLSKLVFWRTDCCSSVSRGVSDLVRLIVLDEQPSISPDTAGTCPGVAILLELDYRNITIVFSWLGIRVFFKWNSILSAEARKLIELKITTRSEMIWIVVLCVIINNLTEGWQMTGVCRVRPWPHQPTSCSWSDSHWLTHDVEILWWRPPGGSSPVSTVHFIVILTQYKLHCPYVPVQSL